MPPAESAISPGSERPIRQGHVTARVATEFPGLAIPSIEVPGRPRRSPEPVRQRLRDLSDRFYGAHAVHLRERPIPWAYRVFFRQIGLDPDQVRTPIEQLALERLEKGAFKSTGLPDDAIKIATAETGVALVVLVAEALAGAVGIRDVAPGESLAGDRRELAQGTLVLADERRPVAPLFGPITGDYAVDSDTRGFTIAAVQVAGVPQIAVEEALWLAAGAIETA